ncbi:Dam family site-specific DNA-(adenine-N6)-methyltransferase [Lysinibacillus sp.]|uniref:Dam family site-specific DNA-(adenine-N6)-methyltransferase n=1 Tax=Lysinibacillus sp. TaxID=1869345 RepID=UPI0028975FFF|nr:Dam family site-specific DNA-(adenine-N6)-methyltransferase [Lysinibacillus sp.]
MRYIGSKVNLLEEIENFIKENINDNSSVFTDLFSGTGSVAEYFKKDYEVNSNDFLYFSYVLQQAKVVNNSVPEFKGLKQLGIEEPVYYLENAEFDIDESYFITKNYSPYNQSERMYLSIENASRIDFIRQCINKWKAESLITELEYFYLLAVLIEAVPYVSNISGTYGAYLKHWDKRALGKLTLEPINVTNNSKKNSAYNMDSNELVKTLRGDILYIDTPYNSRQYITNYHLLETIALYDYPEVYGKTGLRPYENQKSKFCSKKEVYSAYDNLIKNARHRHIIISYSTDGILSIDEITEILLKHGVSTTFNLKKIPYRKYKSKHEQESNELFELLFYVQKDIPTILDEEKPFDLFSINDIEVEGINESANSDYISVVDGQHSSVAVLEKPITKPVKPVKIEKYKKIAYVKSPLNYVGGKFKLLNQIIPLFPERINTFVDLFAGGLNVGINVNANKIVANDINTFVVDVLNAMKNNSEQEILGHIKKRINEFNLSKENEEGFKAFRDVYNKNKNALDLYTLVCYSFNYQFRFNNNLEYNNPFGRNRSQFSPALEKKLIEFINTIQNKNVEIYNNEFQNIDFSQLTPEDLVYCDPPYLITTGSYNDGNRGFKDWDLKQEQKLLQILDELNSNGIRFALSNVLVHKGKKNELLIEWSKKYNVHHLNYNYSNSSHNTSKGESDEVLITNY